MAIEQGTNGFITSVPVSSVLKAVKDLIDTLCEFQEDWDAGVLLLLVELFEIVIYAIRVSIGEDVLHKDYHVVMMYQKYKFPVSLLFDLS